MGQEREGTEISDLKSACDMARITAEGVRLQLRERHLRLSLREGLIADPV